MTPGGFRCPEPSRSPRSRLLPRKKATRQKRGPFPRRGRPVEGGNWGFSFSPRAARSICKPRGRVHAHADHRQSVHQLPDEARTRTYTASIVSRWRATTFVGTLSDARIVSVPFWSPYFEIGVAGRFRKYVSPIRGAAERWDLSGDRRRNRSVGRRRRESRRRSTRISCAVAISPPGPRGSIGGAVPMFKAMNVRQATTNSRWSGADSTCRRLSDNLIVCGVTLCAILSIAACGSSSSSPGSMQPSSPSPPVSTSVVLSVRSRV